MFYRVHLCWAGFELTTLVVIGTDCIGSYKSNYHTITATLPYVQNLRLKFFITGLLHFTQPQIQPRFCEDTVIVTLPPPPPTHTHIYIHKCNYDLVWSIWLLLFVSQLLISVVLLDHQTRNQCLSLPKFWVRIPVYSIQQHYVIKFASDLRQVGGFLHQ
jgi:hypothetical protein